MFLWLIGCFSLFDGLVRWLVGLLFVYLFVLCVVGCFCLFDWLSGSFYNNQICIKNHLPSLVTFTTFSNFYCLSVCFLTYIYMCVYTK